MKTCRTIYLLNWGAPGLGKLSRHSPDLGHLLATPEHHDQCHLYDHSVRIPDLVGLKLAKRLSTVTTHQHKCLPPAGLGHLFLEVSAFSRENERRHLTQRIQTFLNMGLIGVLGLLQGSVVGPAVNTPILKMERA